MSYNARDDAARSYDDAIEAMRAKVEALKAAGAKQVRFIGDALMIQGDCLEVMPALGRVETICTDPPYGMAFRSNHRKTKHKAIANDGDVSLLQWACRLPAQHSKYIWMRWDNLPEVPLPRSLITWVKNNHSMGDLEGEHGRKTEVCAFYRGPDHRWPQQRPVDVVMCPRTGNNFHPTEKPVQLMLEVASWTAGTILDPFAGSGTTGVAATQLGRKFIGIELDPEYFEIACKRVEEAWNQPRLFDEPKAAKAVNGNLFDGDAA